MIQQKRRARWELTALTAGFLALTGCYVKDQLLEPQNPGTVQQSSVQSAAGALALRVGAIGRIRNVVDGGDERLWQQGGHLADEFKNADFQPTRADIDRRSITTNNGDVPYATITQQRGFLRDALGAMNQYSKDSTVLISELWMGLGFLEMSLAENYCNGIPLGHTNAPDIVLGPALTNAQVYDSASAHLDSALNLNKTPGTNVQALVVDRANRILKARILIDQGKYAEAAALVPESAVPTSYQYLFTTSSGTNGGLEDNGLWQIQVSTARITVSDSFDIISGVKYVVANQLPFVSAKDPRVPVIGPTGTAEDGITPFYRSTLWANRDDPIAMVSGIDARLIEAEARLNASDIAGMMTILNTKLRGVPQAIGNTAVPAMAPLATPTTQSDAISLFFREKAFWTFGRGQRLSDLRRLMRQYNRPEEQVFPTGRFSFGGVETGTYGHDVNLPVTDAELPNPNFTGCIDRKP
ncbi:MAG TPA: hypothetical protein VGM82_05450 [Gemmatimonadaceae bacterium]|jgi:hypothetical protein